MYQRPAKSSGSNVSRVNLTVEKQKAVDEARAGLKPKTPLKSNPAVAIKRDKDKDKQGNSEKLSVFPTHSAAAAAAAPLGARVQTAPAAADTSSVLVPAKEKIIAMSLIPAKTFSAFYPQYEEDDEENTNTYVGGGGMLSNVQCTLEQKNKHRIAIRSDPIVKERVHEESRRIRARNSAPSKEEKEKLQQRAFELSVDAGKYALLAVREARESRATKNMKKAAQKQQKQQQGGRGKDGEKRRRKEKGSAAGARDSSATAVNSEVDMRVQGVSKALGGASTASLPASHDDRNRRGGDAINIMNGINGKGAFKDKDDPFFNGEGEEEGEASNLDDSVDIESEPLFSGPSTVYVDVTSGKYTDGGSSSSSSGSEDGVDDDDDDDDDGEDSEQEKYDRERGEGLDAQSQQSQREAEEALLLAKSYEEIDRVRSRLLQQAGRGNGNGVGDEESTRDAEKVAPIHSNTSNTGSHPVDAVIETPKTGNVLDHSYVPLVPPTPISTSSSEEVSISMPMRAGNKKQLRMLTAPASTALRSMNGSGKSTSESPRSLTAGNSNNLKIFKVSPKNISHDANTHANANTNTNSNAGITAGSPPSSGHGHGKFDWDSWDAAPASASVVSASVPVSVYGGDSSVGGHEVGHDPAVDARPGSAAMDASAVPHPRASSARANTALGGGGDEIDGRDIKVGKESKERKEGKEGRDVAEEVSDFLSQFMNNTPAKPKPRSRARTSTDRDRDRQGGHADEGGGDSEDRGRSRAMPPPTKSALSPKQSQSSQNSHYSSRLSSFDGQGEQREGEEGDGEEESLVRVSRYLETVKRRHPSRSPSPMSRGGFLIGTTIGMGMTGFGTGGRSLLPLSTGTSGGEASTREARGTTPTNSASISASASANVERHRDRHRDEDDDDDFLFQSKPGSSSSDGPARGIRLAGERVLEPEPELLHNISITRPRDPSPSNPYARARQNARSTSDAAVDVDEPAAAAPTSHQRVFLDHQEHQRHQESDVGGTADTENGVIRDNRDNANEQSYRFSDFGMQRVAQMLRHQSPDVHLQARKSIGNSSSNNHNRDADIDSDNAPLPGIQQRMGAGHRHKTPTIGKRRDSGMLRRAEQRESEVGLDWDRFKSHSSHPDPLSEHDLRDEKGAISPVVSTAHLNDLKQSNESKELKELNLKKSARQSETPTAHLLEHCEPSESNEFSDSNPPPLGASASVDEFKLRRRAGQQKREPRATVRDSFAKPKRYSVSPDRTRMLLGLRRTLDKLQGSISSSVSTSVALDEPYTPYTYAAATPSLGAGVSASSIYTPHSRTPHNVDASLESLAGFSISADNHENSDNLNLHMPGPNTHTNTNTHTRSMSLFDSSVDSLSHLSGAAAAAPLGFVRDNMNMNMPVLVEGQERSGPSSASNSNNSSLATANGRDRDRTKPGSSSAYGKLMGPPTGVSGIERLHTPTIQNLHSHSQASSDSLSRFVTGNPLVPLTHTTSGVGGPLSRSYQPPSFSGTSSGPGTDIGIGVGVGKGALGIGGLGLVGGSAESGTDGDVDDTAAAFEALELAAAAGDAVGRLMADMAGGGRGGLRVRKSLA